MKKHRRRAAVQAALIAALGTLVTGLLPFSQGCLTCDLVDGQVVCSGDLPTP